MAKAKAVARPCFSTFFGRFAKAVNRGFSCYKFLAWYAGDLRLKNYSLRLELERIICCSMDTLSVAVACMQCGSNAAYCFNELHSLIDPSSASRILFCTNCGATLDRPYFPPSAKRPNPPTREEQGRILAEFVSKILIKHNDLVEKFLVIAERKVAVLDDYGDENWDALGEEIDRCVVKIAKRGQPFFRTDKARIPGPKFRHLPPHFVDGCALYLSSGLGKKFREYYDKKKAISVIGLDFSRLTGVDFEVYVAKLLKESGFDDVAGTSATGDQGADLIAKLKGKTIAIQVKGYSGSVGNDAVQEVVAALKFYKADEAWVVTNSSFTASARSLAQANNVRLIDGHDLKHFANLVSQI